MRLAFLGTGLMGLPMAGRLLAAGHHLTAWNRTRAKAEPLAAAGADLTESPAEAVIDADIVFMILESGPVVAEVLFDRGVVETAKPGAVLVDMSSISPEEARRHAARLARAGVKHIDAPVSGGPEGARDGKLAIMAGGAPEDYARVESYLKNLGRPTLVGAAGAGQFAKLASQMILSTAMTAVAEALLFARAQDIDPVKVIEALSGGYADSRVLQTHGRRMVERDFRPGGHVHTFVKDLKAAHGAAARGNLQLPLCAQAFERFQRLADSGKAQCDISAMALEVEARNQPLKIGSGSGRFPDSLPEA